MNNIVINGFCEKLVCKFCGKEYYSKGKRDPGYCRDCAMTFIKGPFDGKKVGEIIEDNRSTTEIS